MQQEERRRTRRCRGRRWMRTDCLEVADDQQNNAGREESRRIDIEVGAKSLAGAAVNGLVTAALGVVLAVCRHRTNVGVNRSRADVAEHDEESHTDEQPGRQAPAVHCGQTSERTGPCQACGPSLRSVRADPTDWQSKRASALVQELN